VTKSFSAAAERIRLTSPAGTAAAGSDAAVRELMAIREIVHAFLTADRPEEVFRFALERVSPVVGATFASVYLVDGASELMRLAAAYNWPQRYEPWLGEMRVRLGFGPSGEAASERRAIEVPDVFADPSLEDWQEVANELGFRALVALPLQTSSRVLGAVTFYFADARGFSTERRGLLRIVAAQMAATAEKAALIDDLRRANAALTESKAELEQQYLAVLEARRVKDEFLTNVTHELRTPLTAVMGYISLLQEEFSGPLTDHQRNDLALARDASDRLLALIDNLLEMTTLKRGGMDVQVETFDPRDLLRDAAAATKGRPDSTELRIEVPPDPVQYMRTDRRKLGKILSSLISNAYKFTARGVVTASLEVANGRALYRVQDTGIGVPLASQRLIFEEFRQVDGSLTRRYGGTGLGLALSRRLARLLGGDIELVSVPGEGATFTLEIPLEYQPVDPAVLA
jgi:signal transduction histidine kinase